MFYRQICIPKIQSSLKNDFVPSLHTGEPNVEILDELMNNMALALRHHLLKVQPPNPQFKSGLAVQAVRLYVLCFDGKRSSNGGFINAQALVIRSPKVQSAKYDVCT